MTSKGKLIVIEGTDGAGKETQSKKLLDHLESVGIRTAYADFPQHGQKSAAMVDNYLNGKYGAANEVDPKIASIFYAIDRYDASFIMRRDLEEGKIIVCNRYVSANEGHQGGKVDDKKDRAEFIKWVEDLEYNFFRIPRPDMIILLYVPYEVAQKNVGTKGDRGYLNGKKRDIHEEDPEHQKKAELAFLEIAKEQNWKIIECTRDGKMISIEEVHERVWTDVRDLLRI